MAVLLHGPWKVRNWITYYRSLYPSSKPDDFEEYLKSLKRNLDEPGRFEAMMELGSSSRTPSESRFAEIYQPVQVIMGTKDPDWRDSEKESEFTVEALYAERHMIEGAGHYPQTEMPEEVAPLIIDFLSRV